VADRSRLKLPRPYNADGGTVSGAVHRPHDTPADDLPIRLLYVGSGDLHPAQRRRHQRLTLSSAVGFPVRRRLSRRMYCLNWRSNSMGSLATTVIGPVKTIPLSPPPNALACSGVRMISPRRRLASPS